MPAYYLEALTVTLGFIILLAEAFVPTKKNHGRDLPEPGGLP